MSYFQDHNNFDRTARPTGLPSHENLVSLADTYLTLQANLWGDHAVHVSTGSHSNDARERLAMEFTTTYRSKVVPPHTAIADGASDRGACYLRYSDDNSNPRSLNQQLENILRRARAESVWIPWNLVFADAAITGRSVDRPGFQLLSHQCEVDESGFTHIYVDDLSRLSRDLVNSLDFEKKAEFHGKRLKGVSDAYDSAVAMAKLNHSVSAYQHESFSKQLAQKVIRGERDAFNQGRNTGAIPLGYSLKDIYDADGKVVVNEKGRVATDVVIDEQAADLVRRVFTMYAHDHLSPERIARALNADRALDKTNWGASRIKSMLSNERYRGRILWARTANRIDPKTGKRKAVPRSPENILERHDENMRIVSNELWHAVVERRNKASNYRTPSKAPGRSRQDVYPTRLFDLFCQCCDKPLWLMKAGTYGQLFCGNGKSRAKNCTLSTSKAVMMIDECLIAPIAAAILDPKTIETIQAKANEYIVEESKKPVRDVTEIDKRLKSIAGKIKRLDDQFGMLDDGPAADAVLKKIDKLGAEQKAARQERAIAMNGNVKPRPLDRSWLEALVGDFKGLLHEDVASAHAILAKMVGRVDVSIGEKRGRSHTWIAKFSMNPALGLIEIARKRGCPSTDTLEYLLVRSWTIEMPLTVTIFEIKRKHRIAAKVHELVANGTSKLAIQNCINTDARTVNEALEFAMKFPDEARLYASEVRREWKAEPKFMRISAEALRLSQDHSIYEVAKMLGVSYSTVVRALDYANKEPVRNALAEGTGVDRGRKFPLPQEKYDEIESRLRAGESIRSICKSCGVDRSVVRRIHRTLDRNTD